MKLFKHNNLIELKEQRSAMPKFLRNYRRKHSTASRSMLNNTSYQKLEPESEVDDVSLSEATTITSNKSSEEIGKKNTNHGSFNNSQVINEDVSSSNDEFNGNSLQHYRASMSSSTTYLERVPLDSNDSFDSNLTYRLKSELSKSMREKKKTERNLVKLAKQLQCQTDESKSKDAKIGEVRL